jgi:hypothetical protein
MQSWGLSKHNVSGAYLNYQFAGAWVANAGDSASYECQSNLRDTPGSAAASCCEVVGCVAQGCCAVYSVHELLQGQMV